MAFAHRILSLYNNEIVQKVAEWWLNDEFTDLSSLNTCHVESLFHLAKINPKKELNV